MSGPLPAAAPRDHDAPGHRARVRDALHDPDRLRALEEAPFDDRWQERARQLAHLAAQMLRTELAEVNLIGAEHLYCFASADDDERALPVEVTYCQHVVGTAAAVKIYDSLSHPFVRDNPHAPQLRSYLGIPLVHRGHVVGALCVAQADPRRWTEVEVSLLTELAAELSRD